MFEGKTWKPRNEELLITYPAVLFLVVAYTLAGMLFMPKAVVALIISVILIFLLWYLIMSDVSRKTDRRIILPIIGIAVIIFPIIVIGDMFSMIDLELHTNIMLAYGTTFLAAAMMQILILQVAKGSDV